jgi:hypothetical protein
MPKSRQHFLLPVSAHCLLGHYIKISILQLNNRSLSDRLAFEEPLVVKWIALASTQSHCNYFLPLCVPMKSDSTFIDIIIVVTLRLQLASIRNVEI